MRTQRGWSQDQLTHECHVSLPTIQNIEAGKANPTMEILSKILDSLGFDIHIVPKAFNARTAVDLGVPLSDMRGTKDEKFIISHSTQSPDNLTKEANHWIQLFKFKKFHPREEAVVSLLME